MIRKPNIDEKIEQALNSLEGIQRATPQPWFFARVKGRLSKEEKTPIAWLSSFLARPAMLLASLLIILSFNGFFLLQQGKKAEQSAVSAQSEPQITTDNEYIIASTSSFEYEKLSQP